MKLDPHSFALTGVKVIEASAGTGKTWTLAALYLRLVLGEGRAPLEPRQILVMTFTDAAMEELRERIRERLALAARVFHRDPTAEAKADAFLLTLRDRRAATALSDALRLDSAARSMDEAAIFTIHGWSHRMLREHAFESASLFEQHKIDDPQALQLQVLHDYWRLHIYPLSAEQSHALQDFADSPANLLKALKQRLAQRAHHPLLNQLPAKEAFDTAMAAQGQWRVQVTALESQARALWLTHRLDIEAQLLVPYDKDLKGGSYGKKRYHSHMQGMRLWAEGGASNDDYPVKLSLNELTSKTKINFATPADTFGVFAAIQNLQEALAQDPSHSATLHDHAADWICAEITRRKLQRAEFDFHDLLQRLHHALTQPGSGLPAAIRAQYPVALVDEFQDTDALQYGALQQIYLAHRTAGQNDDSALVMIGDPKQAIYSFRGADLAIYRQARDAAGETHTLSGNFRSSAPLVDAINHVFLQAPQPFPGIVYEPVTAERAASVLPVPRAAGGVWPALTVWTPADPSPARQPVLRAQFEQGVATQIVALLHEGHVKPADIAVLVRTAVQARDIRHALQQRGVPSVYLSERDSVYHSTQALQLWFMLAAVLRPRSLRAIRAAVATRLYGLTEAQREQLLTHDAQLEELVEQFLGWQQVWHNQGVLAMVHALLHERGVAAALLARQHNGERDLTNVLHLAALLQDASHSLQGEGALLRYLGEQIGTDHTNDSGAAQLRLETDAALVKVITLHKSKGLQYPVVFLPFAYTSSKFQKAAGEDADSQAAIDREADEQAESVRLLYVAMTRAERALFMSAATPVRDADKTALARLLNFKKGDQLLQCLQAWQENPNICVQPLPPANDLRWSAGIVPSVQRSALTPKRRHKASWSSTSFSAMTRDQPTGSALPKTAQDELREDRLTDAQDTTPAASRVMGAWTELKGSEKLGTALHELLECQLQLGWPDAATCTAPRWLKLLQRHERSLLDYKVSIDSLQTWTQACAQAVLPVEGGSLRLCDLTAAQAVAELPFVITLSHTSTQVIDHLLHTHVQPGKARQPLTRDHFQGQLTGSLDLVFEYQGRWYVMDYKTNQLDANTQAAMAAKILDKRYDLQYSLYLLALHRLLKLRLPQYDYDTHMGGPLYFFLRLVDQPGCGLYHDKPPRQFIEALDLHLRTGAA